MVLTFMVFMSTNLRRETTVSSGCMINYNEFVRKFKLDFPEADDAEIKFFTRTYFTLDFNKKGRDKGTFIFDNNKIPWYAFVGNYLKIFKHLMIMIWLVNRK